MKTCFVPHCPRQIGQRMLMCARHWRMVPAHLQDEVWRTYRRINDDLSAWCLATSRAALAVIEREAKNPSQMTDVVRGEITWFRSEIERLEARQ